MSYNDIFTIMLVIYVIYLRIRMGKIITGINDINRKMIRGLTGQMMKMHTMSVDQLKSDMELNVNSAYTSLKKHFEDKGI